VVQISGSSSVLPIGTLGLFSWYGSIALAPRLLLDCRPGLGELKKSFFRTFSILMGFVYAATLLASGNLRILSAIAGVLITFISMNYYYIRYFKTYANTGHDSQPNPSPPRL
jgi:hypothetical protein